MAKTTRLVNQATGEEIILEETNDLSKLKNQRMLLGMKGLFYSDIGRKISEKIPHLENSPSASANAEDLICVKRNSTPFFQAGSNLTK